MRRPSDWIRQRVETDRGPHLKKISNRRPIYLRKSEFICGWFSVFRPLFVSIRVHSRLYLANPNTSGEPSYLFLGQFRNFEFALRNRERTTRMKAATGRGI